MARQLKERPYGGGRYTQAGMWSFIRSGLRRKYSRWPPKFDVLNAAKRPSKSSNKKLKWEYKCAKCKRYHPMSIVEVDHIEACGSLKGPEDLAGFVTRLFCEADNLRVLCRPCHKKITEAARC